MTAWDPRQYLKFGSERLRPALDLLARIPSEAPELVYDLGCGPGTVTALLKRRWPLASIVGVDSSATMLDRARRLDADIEWRLGRLESWEPAEPCDVLFSNAVLHWMDGHATLLPRLLGALKPGGILAAQMPNNFSAPTHTAIAETVRAGPWKERLEPHLRERPVHGLEEYFEILNLSTARLELWETTYLHVLKGDDPVVEWTRGTALKPVLQALAANEKDAFLEAYRVRIRAAYPPRKDRRTLLPFKRVFIVAEKQH